MALGLKTVGVYDWQPYVRNVWKPRSLSLLETSRPVQANTGIALPL